MALHTQLPIYKAAYRLLDVVTDIVTNMERAYKRSIGEKISLECLEITVLVFRANVASDKAPHLSELLERLQVIELMLRLGMDKRKIPREAYSSAIELTTSIGKQCSGWKNAATNRPHRGGHGSHD
jgi:hypothetical protein